MNIVGKILSYRASAQLGLLLTTLTVGIAACTDTHMTPQEGTETGNPPVLDSGLITLVVSSHDVHIVGKKGAVSPGGSDVEVTNTSTGTVTRGKSNSDGSFDIVVNASQDDVFDVRAVAGSASSPVVTVDRGGARVSGTKAVSCSELSASEHDRMSIVASNADKTCTRDSDCVWQETSTACSDQCGRWLVSQTGAQQIRDAARSDGSQFCAAFATQSCTVIHPPCAPQTETPRCISNQCQVDAGDTPTMPSSADCTSAFDPGAGVGYVPVYWFSTLANACLPRVYGGEGGNGNRYASQTECQAACPGASKCPSARMMTYACTKFSVAGDCGEASALCAKSCTSNADCAGDPVGEHCTAAGFCDSSVH